MVVNQRCIASRDNLSQVVPCLCRQWSFPVPLPLPLLGIFGAKQLPLNGGSFPWSDELEHACLAEFIGAAPYSEVPSSNTHAMTEGLL